MAELSINIFYDTLNFGKFMLMIWNLQGNKFHFNGVKIVSSTISKTFPIISSKSFPQKIWKFTTQCKTFFTPPTFWNLSLCDINIVCFSLYFFKHGINFFVFSILQTNTKMDIVPCQLSNISIVWNKAFFFLYTSFKHLHLIMLHWILIATNRFTNTYSYAKGSKYFYPYHHTQEIYPDKYDFPKFLCWNIINSVL